MSKFELEESGSKLRDEVAALLMELRTRIREEAPYNDNAAQIYDNMAEKAHQLHLLVNPKHHRHMLQNRGFLPDTVEFYRHIHPVEDLLAYIEDTSANDDPEDQTLGHDFQFKVYTQRWEHDDAYSLKRTATGWYFQHLSYEGDCDKEGSPILFAALDHDSVAYPNKLGYQLYDLWQAAAELGLSHNQVQEKLDAIAAWVSLCEQNRPETHF